MLDKFYHILTEQKRDLSQATLEYYGNIAKKQQ